MQNARKKKRKKDDAFQFFNRIYFFPNLFTYPFPNIDSIINLDTSQIRKLLRVICFRNRKIMWKAALLVVILSAATNKSKYSINFTISFLKIFLPFLFSPAWFQSIVKNQKIKKIKKKISRLKCAQISKYIHETWTATGVANDCVPRSFGTNNIVCVCNSTYCDNTPEPEPKSPEKGTFHWYVSSRDGLRLSLSKGQIGRCQNDESLTLNIDTSTRYQTILGFGGAFTDSAGMNIKNLSEATQDQLIR